jgi:hypothetical protein
MQGNGGVGVQAQARRSPPVVAVTDLLLMFRHSFSSPFSSSYWCSGGGGYGRLEGARVS